MVQEDLVAFIRARFKALSNPKKARGMAAYMKTEMPFYGVQKPARVLVLREVAERFPVTSKRGYRSAVLALWKQPHREEKYAALHVARYSKKFVEPDSLTLYERLIREGAWWDFVDEVAVQIVGRVLLAHPKETWPTIDEWSDHEDMWLRRSAIISQIKLKDQTDEERLFRFCRARASEKEFFIRKAIGWALREYSKTEPKAVHRFLLKNRKKLSPLSLREGAKQIARIGLTLDDD